jgi:hypothetical protein
VTIGGRVMTHKSGSQPGTFYVRVGERLFETCYDTEPILPARTGDAGSPPSLNWHIHIPSGFIGEGEQDLSVVRINPDHSYYLESERFARLKIILETKEVNLDSLKPLDQEATIRVDYINGRKSSYFDTLFYNQSFINLKGWAVDEVQHLPSGGIIVYLNDRPYLSRFIYMRSDLPAAYRLGANTDAGWGIVIPADSLEEGNHELTFRVLNRDRTGYYSSDLKYHFRFMR